MDKNTERQIIEAAMYAGRLLLENGAEISRVEETIERICHYYGVNSANEFVLTNGIFITVGDKNEPFFAKVEHIPVGSSHLSRVAAVNQLSREIEEGRYTVGEVLGELDRIAVMPGKTKRMQILASGVGSAAFCYLFGGNPADSTAAFFAGVILYFFILFIGTSHFSKIVTNIGGGTLVTLFCFAAEQAGLGDHLNSMVIGSVMPLIPGVPFTNSIRDIVGGDYISGAVRMLDALLVFFCIAIGVGLGFSAAGWITGGLLP